MPLTHSIETLEPRYKVDVILWAIGRRQRITTAEIRARWGVHKATACRWVHDLNDARQRAQCMTVPRAEPTRAPVAMQEARTP